MTTSGSGTFFDGATSARHAVAVELAPEGFILIASNQDRPGAVARLSALLGGWGVNIAGMALGRAEKGGQALFTLTLDDGLTPEQLRAVRDLDVIDSAYLVQV